MQDSASIWETKTTQQLAAVLCAIEKPAEMQSFLRDVMTEKEIIEISSRLEAAKMLADGKKYIEIIEKTKLSSRTIARISEWMQKKTGGYETALNIVTNHHNKHI